MLKGYTKIELTNVETGEIQVVEQENMVTNAVTDLINAKYAYFTDTKYGDTMNNTMYPLAEKAFGGILLFEEPLAEEEDECILPAPAANPLTGYADNQANNTTDTKRGSRNLTESGPVQNGYKYVYDFSTSQGNGTISALALTNVAAGAAPYTNTAVKNTSYNYSNAIIRVKIEQATYDFTADMINIAEFNFNDYSFVCILKINDTTLRRRKYQFNFKTSHLAGTFNIPLLLSEELITVDNSKTIINVASRFIDGKDGYIYAVYKASGQNLYISRLTKETLAQDESYGTKTITGLYSSMTMVSNAYNTAGNISYPSKDNDCTVHKGCLYIGYRGQYMYKINLSNTADIETFTPGVNNSYPICERDENSLFVGAYYLFEDGSAVRANQYTYTAYGSSYPNNFDNTISQYSSGYTAFYEKNKSINFYIADGNVNICMAVMINYLATINNLDEPVVKTADKTMKITYTLTEQ